MVSADAAVPLDRLLAADSTQNLSRIVCPRRLMPNTSYLACVVPAFDAGRKSGLGLAVSAEDEGDKRRKTIYMTPRGWLVRYARNGYQPPAWSRELARS